MTQCASTSAQSRKLCDQPAKAHVCMPVLRQRFQAWIMNRHQVWGRPAAAGREAGGGGHLPALPAAPLHVQHLLQDAHPAHDQNGPPPAALHAAHHPQRVPVPRQQEVRGVWELSSIVWAQVWGWRGMGVCIDVHVGMAFSQEIMSTGLPMLVKGPDE
eukprot:scaffold95954_cov18-Tisochrysis_lutea.AAC.2